MAIKNIDIILLLNLNFVLPHIYIASDMCFLADNFPQSTTMFLDTRETVPSLTSDKWRKRVSVLSHYFVLPHRAN